MKVLLGFLGVGLLIYTIIDCSRTPDAEVPSSLSQAGWLVMIVLLPFLGPMFWLLASRTDDTSASTANTPTRPPTRPSGMNESPGITGPAGPRPSASRTRRPIGPDDDPEFLRGL